MLSVRIAFNKTGAAKYISHLDLNRVFMKMFTRADLPLAYTEGFNPRPRVVFSATISLGVESLAELVDVRLTDNMPPEKIKAALTREAPEGIVIKNVYLPTRDFKEIAYSVYRVFVKATADKQTLDALFAAPVVMEKRSKHKNYETDIMENVVKLTVSDRDADGYFVIDAVLQSNNEAFLNPDYLVRAVRTVAEVPDAYIVKLGILTAGDDPDLIRELL